MSKHTVEIHEDPRLQSILKLTASSSQSNSTMAAADTSIAITADMIEAVRNSRYFSLLDLECSIITVSAFDGIVSSVYAYGVQAPAYETPFTPSRSNAVGLVFQIDRIVDGRIIEIVEAGICARC